MSKLSATLVIGDLIVPNGEWCDVIDTTVAGDLIVSGGSAGLRVAGSMIDGNLTATRAAAAADPLSSGADVVCNTVVCNTVVCNTVVCNTVVCNTSVKGNLDVDASAASVPRDIGLRGGNTIGGSLIFDANRASANTTTGNGVGGNLVCVANGIVTASENTAGAKSLGQCG